VIGYYWSDTDVGRYSLAAVFAEGLYQSLIVVRNQVNPLLAQLSLAPDPAPIVRLVHHAWRYLYPGTAIIYLAGFGALHLLLTHYFQTPDASEVSASYLLVGAGILVASGFIPFDGILLHSGRPGLYTLLALLVALTNVVLNLTFVPNFSIRGAALATGLSVAMSVVYLNVILRWQLRYSYLGRPRAS
jgi:stage V sporulation protein B